MEEPPLGPAWVAWWGSVLQHCGVAPVSTQSQRSPGMLRHFACPASLMQSPPPLPKAARRFGAPGWAAPVSPEPSCVHGMPAPREEEEESREEVVVVSGRVWTCRRSRAPFLSPSHPVLVVFQGGVGSPAVLEELGVWGCPRGRGWGTSALALQGIYSR